ncbi:MBL fold metallo-hydrolase [Cytophagaceae bacterium ABcell3]|nr:MBL fold metallo-hydrolase [Cytophagaceae bacterium ABcell3]
MYLSNPELPFVLKGYKGNTYKKGRFVNDSGTFPPSLFQVLKWKLSKNPQQAEKERDTFKPDIITGTDFVSETRDHIAWLGHASFYIRFNGKVFITDPCFYDLPLIKRNQHLPCPAKDIDNVDYLLLSHAHRDHFDRKSYEEIVKSNPNLKALIPLKAASLLKDRIHYQEAGWYQKFSICKEVEVIFLPANHWSKRGLLDLNNMLWGSFLLKSGDKTIYFAGDTSTSKHFKTIAEIFGPIDYCLMPIGAYKPSSLMQPSHLSPTEAISAFNDLRGNTFIPMHYGTYDLSDEPMGEPVRTIYENKNKINGDLKIPKIGEVLPIS